MDSWEALQIKDTAPWTRVTPRVLLPAPPWNSRASQDPHRASPELPKHSLYPPPSWIPPSIPTEPNPRSDGHRMGSATVEAIPASHREFQHRHTQTRPGDIDQKAGSSSQVPKSQIFQDSQDLICSSAARVSRARSHRHLLRLRLLRSLGSAKFWELCVPPWPFCQAWYSWLLPGDELPPPCGSIGMCPGL